MRDPNPGESASEYINALCDETNTSNWLVTALARWLDARVPTAQVTSGWHDVPPCGAGCSESGCEMSCSCACHAVA